MEVMQYEEVTFTNTSTDAVSYAWDFGDGENSTEMSPTHTYMSAGTFTVTLVATNADGDNTSEQDIEVSAPVSSYTLDGTEYAVDSTMFWHSSGMGFAPYIRLITSVDGQDNPDLLKLYTNQGLNELPGTYSWAAGNGMMDPFPSDPGNYDVGYTAGYAGMQYDWTSIGKTGSGELVITEIVTDVYHITGEFVLSVGTFDFSSGEFTETGVSNLSLDYTGVITPL